jgi:hypothetical protein
LANPSLNLIISQRLVRRICDQCRTELIVDSNMIDKIIEKYQATNIGAEGSFGVNLTNMFDVVWLHKSKTHWMCRDANIELSGHESLIYPINYLQQKYFQDLLSAEPMRTKRKIDKFFVLTA